MASNDTSTVESVPDSEARDIQALVGEFPIHYREAFAIRVEGDRTPEDWARLMLEGATPRKQARMLSAWRLLGLDLSPPGTDGHVLGWRVERSDDRAVVLAVDSRTLSARLVLASTPGRVVHTMVVAYRRWTGRPVWAAIAPGHRAFVRGLLDDLARHASRR